MNVYKKNKKRKKNPDHAATNFPVSSNKIVKLKAKGDKKLHSLKCRGVPISGNLHPLYHMINYFFLEI